MFQLYLEHLTYFLDVSNVTWNVAGVIWNASSFNTIHVPVKRRIGMFLFSMHKNFKGPLKNKERVYIFLNLE
jgi:hypothetical protein